MFYDEGNFGRKLFRAGPDYNRKTKKSKSNRWQAVDGEFRCVNCKQMVLLTPAMGTAYRNHCPYCLYSLHVDTKPGNRASTCHARMEPVGLTCKRIGPDKYGRERGGDIMLVHSCRGCGTVNINRIAGDDSCHEILDVFKRSSSMGEGQKESIEKAGIRLLQSDEVERLHTALFGKTLPR